MMKWMLTYLAVGGMFFTTGCGGRAHLTEDGPRTYSRLMNLQANNRPRRLLAPLSAKDAKVIMSNHAANHSVGSKRGGRSGGSGGGGAQRTATTLKRVGY